MKSILITGASKGIGLATTKRFAEEGYCVFAVSRNPEASPELMNLVSSHPNITIKALDVRSEEAVIQGIIDSFGPIDILLNNAGVGLLGVPESFSIDQINQVFATNVLGVVKITNAVLPGMRARNAGKIITLSSVVGPMPDLRQCFYSGSKAMIEHYTASLKASLQEAGYAITVANINPGPVLTHFETSTPVGDRFGKKDNPYPQMATVEEEWRTLMRAGRPVEETVKTILKVVQTDNPVMWNPTEQRVQQNFAEIYRDPTGATFGRGPSF